MFAKYALQNGGKIVPIIPDFKDSNGTGVMNPSIYNDNGMLLVNVRHVNYAIYHCHTFFHEYGPLQYIHGENDRVLRTTNYLAKLNDDLHVEYYFNVDTSVADVNNPPQWEFIGLEDARLVRWHGELMLIGVRRDDNTTGRGRMEMMAITDTAREVGRHKIPAPGADDSYCEKNWMPILDKPFNFIKWTCPTEVVSYDPNSLSITSKIIDSGISFPLDIRGGSQVIPYKDHYIAVTHEAANMQSELGQKDAIYNHRFVIWDKFFNIVRVTDSFNFLNGAIEFCTGMCIYNNTVIISFGRQDNSAYLIQLPLKAWEDYIWWN